MPVSLEAIRSSEREDSSVPSTSTPHQARCPVCAEGPQGEEEELQHL